MVSRAFHVGVTLGSTLLAQIPATPGPEEARLRPELVIGEST